MSQLKVLSSENVEEIEDVRALLDRVVAEAGHGEYSTDDLKRMLKRGTAWGVIVRDEENVPTLVCLWEMLFYPKRTEVNVMALAGKRLFQEWKTYGDLMCEIWSAQGADSVTCYCNKAMTRLLGHLGFKPVYYVLERGLK